MGLSPTPRNDDWWTKAQQQDQPVQSAPRQGGGIVVRPGPQAPPQTQTQAEIDRGRLTQQQQQQQSFEAGGGVDATADQRKAAGFYSRALNADERYDALGVGPRGLLESYAADVAPSTMNTYWDSPERQAAGAYERDFIGATLRYESGAAIPPTEYENQRKTYFPMPGDTEDTIRIKAQLRKQAVESLRLGGGSAASLVPPPGTATGGDAGTRAGQAVGEMLNPDDPPQNSWAKGSFGREKSFDEDVMTGAQAAQNLRAPRMTTPQEAQVRAAIAAGDVGLADTLLKRFMGTSPGRSSLQRTVADYRRNPGGGIAFGYQDQALMDAKDKEDYGDWRPAAKQSREAPIGALDSGVRQAANTITLGGADWASAGMNTLFGGGRGNTMAERFKDNMQYERAMTDADFRVNPKSSWTGTILGGLLLPTGSGGAAASARAGELARVGSTARTVTTAGNRARATRLAMEGAGYGGVRGLVDNAHRPNPLPYGLTGAVLGGAVNYAGGRLFGNRVPAKDAEDVAALARAGAQENVPLSRPIVDAGKRDTMMYLEGSIGGGRVRPALMETQDAIEGRAGALAQGGVTQEGGVMGQRIQDAALRYKDRSGAIVRRAYDRASELAGNTTVRGERAVQAIDDQIAELARNPNTNAPAINFLKEVRGDFVDEAGNVAAKDVGSIRDIRTGLRGQINNRNLTHTDVERRMGIVLKAASEDIARDLGVGAPQAARQFARADKLYQTRRDEINQVVNRVVGRVDDRLSGEQVWQRVKTMMSEGGDARRLGRLWNKLTPEEGIDAAASIASRMGRRSADEDFSPALFVSSARALSKEARNVVFGPQGAQSIENLALLSQALKNTTARLNNSQSGKLVQWGTFIRNFLPASAFGAAGGGALGGPVGAALGGTAMALGGVAVRNISSRLLMSPRVTGLWLKMARANTPDKMRATARSALVGASRDPENAPYFESLHRMISNILGEGEDQQPQATIDAGGRK